MILPGSKYPIVMYVYFRSTQSDDKIIFSISLFFGVESCKEIKEKKSVFPSLTKN